MKEAGLILCLLVVAASWGVAGELPSVERGTELFNSTELGTNGRSCADCHPGGKGLAAAASFKEDVLAGIINQCIKKPLKGKPLAADSIDLKSLIIYIRSLAPAEKL